MSTIHERLEERRHKARINLARESGPGLGLIILRASGVFYTHETVGTLVTMPRSPALARAKVYLSGEIRIDSAAFTTHRR